MSISSIGRGPIPSPRPSLNCLAGDKEMVKHLPGMSRETGKPRGLQPINPVSRARLAGEEDMSFDIGRLADLSACEQSRNHDQRVDVFENWNGAMVRPRFFVRNPSADRHVETAAQSPRTRWRLSSRGLRRWDMRDGIHCKRGISQRIAKLVGALTRKIRRAPGRPHASAATVRRSKVRPTSAAKMRAFGVATMRRPLFMKSFCPSHLSSALICRLTAPCVRPSSDAAAA